MDIWQSITKTPTPDLLIATNQKTWSHLLQVIAAEAVLSAAQTPASTARLIAAAAQSFGAFRLPFQCLQLVPVLTKHPCALPCLYVCVRHCARRMIVSVVD